MNELAQASPWAGLDVGGHLFLFSPMIALVCTMLAVVACPIFLGRGARTVAAIVSLGLFVTLMLALRVANAVADGGTSGLSTEPGAGLLIVDNLSVWFQIILVVFIFGGGEGSGVAVPVANKILNYYFSRDREGASP